LAKVSDLKVEDKAFVLIVLGILLRAIGLMTRDFDVAIPFWGVRSR
jgi:hypothetical protein